MPEAVASKALTEAARRLADFYRRHPKEAKTQYKNCEIFVITGPEPQDLLPCRRLAGLLAGHDLETVTAPAFSGAQDKARNQALFAGLGYREATFDQPEFAASWAQYLKACARYKTEPSSGATDPQRRRSFFVAATRSNDPA